MFAGGIEAFVIVLGWGFTAAAFIGVVTGEYPLLRAAKARRRARRE